MTIERDEAQFEDTTVVDMEPVVARRNLPVTFFVGVLMLVIGLLAGYFGRPLVTPRSLDGVPVASADTGMPSPTGDAVKSNPSSSAGTLMDAVVAKTRHFKGSPDAPVTVVEFGDFQ